MIELSPIKDTGGPAFPLDRDCCNVGMTLRDYVAIKAMQSLITNFLNKELDEIDPQGWMDGLAMDSYSMADAMLKARTK
jgi:hypothetical protein